MIAYRALNSYDIADYQGFLDLMKAVRKSIGPNKKITAAVSGSPDSLEKGLHPDLHKYVNHFYIMTYVSSNLALFKQRILTARPY